MLMLATLRSRLKAELQGLPAVWDAYQGVKRQVLRMRTALYGLSDMRRVWRHMHWAPSGSAYWALSAELLFQYHKLEKGLVMPGRPRLFGTDPVRATIRLLLRWERAGLTIDDPIYLGALATVQAYCLHLDAKGLASQSPALAEVQAFLSQRAPLVEQASSQLSTPVVLQPPAADIASDPLAAFAALSLARRSVREFDPQPVDLAAVRRAVELAALAPSACNRQPNKVYLLQQPERIAAALALQNGNRGFGHTVPLLAVLTVDMTGFFDGSERNQPYIDGGLFAMGLMLALRAQGLGSCPLNWCVSPATDTALHTHFQLPDAELVTMLLAIGVPVQGLHVPRSPRRAVGAILQQI